MDTPIRSSITVAVACEENPGMEYKGVDTRTRATIFKECFEAGNKHTGNFLAIVHALRLLKRNNVKTEAIYSDSDEALLWIKNKKYPNTIRTGKKREKLRQAIEEAQAWLDENEYSTKILRWDKSWGDVLAYTSPEYKNGADQKHLKINT